MDEHVVSEGSGLSPTQTRVAHVFFSMPESDGFLLAGGAALLAHGLITRPTTDLDFFTAAAAGVQEAALAFAQVAAEQGWTVEIKRESQTYCHLVIYTPEAVEMDLAVDAAAIRPPTLTIAGPSYDQRELAGHKVLALFGRAEVRDLTDVYDLVQRFGSTALLAEAHAIDDGFDQRVLAHMIQARLSQVTDAELPTSDPKKLRDFYSQWCTELEASAQ